MINAEMWEFHGRWYALIGCEFYGWHQGRKIWIRAFWLCGHNYERARYQGKIHKVKIRMSRIKF